MKRSYLAGIGIITLLIVTPAFAQMDMTRQPGQTDVQGQQQAQDQGMGQGMGMMGQGMMKMRPSMMKGHCMMMDQHHDMMGMMGCPNMAIMQYVKEVDGYLANSAQLGLTQDQKDHIQKIKEELEIALIQKCATLRIAILKLQTLMNKANPDKQAVNRQIDEISGLSRDMQKMVVNTVIDARNILNPEQRKKVLQNQ
ncbi:Spy/CpxP family protein refolding chaperone [Dissulfurimicrobium hydrothermale]|uniref:Spy/CpxP family protein refolding chaperone n=1 Tax=Dissulfurimicrobium hydrothermale TaxID=1750598 RepID=UPI001ED9E22F|nr:periplasmic heavy metal sensor [Dissulfurimicrobium hydrothermale]UKL13231.1 periplasmic heavy metal sensor [Dissulfurimicrobium hydrothermale]